MGMRSTRRASALGMIVALAGLLGPASCLYDPDERCDPGQRFDSAAGSCVCDERQDLIAGEHGCVACGEHEQAQNDVCACVDGYTRASVGAACTDAALGSAGASDRDGSDAGAGGACESGTCAAD